MAEHQGSERTCNERDGEGQQAGQQRDGRIGGVSEEHLREIVRSGGAVCVEVVELDGGADHGSGDHGFHRIAHHCLRFTSGCFDCTHWITPVTSVMRCRLPTCADNVFLLFSCVQSSFRCLTPCGRQQKDPAVCRAINVCVLRASNPCLRWRGIEAALLESVRQRKRNNNSCGQQYACNHSVHRGEPPFAKSCIRRIVRSN